MAVLTANLRAVEAPALILRLPHEAIVATSLSAERLLGRSGPDLLGRPFGEFTQGPSHEPVELVASGLMAGYVTDRRLTGTGARARFWVHGLDVVPPIDLVLALLLLPPSRAEEPTAHPDLARSLPVTGSTDESFTIEGISADDDEEVLGHTPAHFVGQSLLSLIDPVDMTHVMVVIEHMSMTTGAMAVQTRVVCKDQSILTGQLLLVPRARAGEYIFAFIAAEPGTTAGAAAVAAVLRRLDTHIRYDDSAATMLGSDTARSLARIEMWRKIPGVSDLSRREMEIVSRLMDGDRVPTIAAALFLTRSTIRNHLSAAYSKIGVRSQQELINLLRPNATAGL
jgi:DNA-binding CsgD family transcriptional regulator